ncbi:MAG: hypothetical protein JWM11_478 [Planctomycetaceae bacterium]|nr:hypothetical protein [Planctomycetaceae bacterium]
MTPSAELLDRLDRLQRVGKTLAGVSGIVCLLSWFFIPDQFYAAWLTAYFYWLGMALGCLVLAMLHGMTGGAWGRAIRRVIEAGYQTIPVLALLFIPIWLGVAQIYEWADPEVVRQSETLARKAGYLNVVGFQIRAIVYFVVWVAITWALDRSSPNEEPALESPRVERLQRHSGLSFIAFGVTMTLAAVDWSMSLEPEWFSTMYGLIFIAGQGVSGLSFALLVVVTLREFKPWSEIVNPARLNDLGNLLLAAVMFWAYCSFFQYLVIWSGNLPEENVWYVRRTQGIWQYFALILAGLHFAVPFLLLLSRDLKQQAVGICRVAILLLCMRYVDLYWLIVPAFRQSQSGLPELAFLWLDVAALGAIGGVWLTVFAWRLSVRIRLPIYDPSYQEALDEQSGHAVVA